MKYHVDYTISGTMKRIECDNLETAMTMAGDLLNVSQAASVTIAQDAPTPIQIVDITDARLLEVFRTLNQNNRRMVYEMAVAVQNVQRKSY